MTIYLNNFTQARPIVPVYVESLEAPIENLPSEEIRLTVNIDATFSKNNPQLNELIAKCNELLLLFQEAERVEQRRQFEVTHYRSRSLTPTVRGLIEGAHINPQSLLESP